MIIRRVKLANILSHESSEVLFPDGIVAIVGPNGAGKSSIIDSIYTALFTDTSIDIRGRKKEFIVMRGRKRGEIEVLLEVGGVKYLIAKELGVDTPAQATLYILDGDRRKVRSTGVSNVVNELGKVLGLSAITVKDLRNMVRSTVISLQDELTKIVDITDSERREWILSLLGLSYLEKSLEVVKKYTGKKDMLEGRLESEKSLLSRRKEELNKLKSERDSLNSKLLEVNKTVGELKSKLSSINEKVGLVKECVELVGRLKSLIIFKRVKELEGIISELEVLDGWDANEYSHTCKRYEDMLNELRTTKDQITTSLQSTSNKLGVLIETYESLNTLVNRLRSKNEELTGLINKKKALKELYSVYVDKLEATKECPICGSLIKDQTAIKDRLTQELIRLNDEIKELISEYTMTKVKVDMAQNSLERLSKLTSKAEVLEKSLQELSDKLNTLNDKALNICSSLSEDFNIPTSLRECVESLNTLKSRLSKLRSELELLRSLRAGHVYGDVDVEVKALQARLTAITSRLALRITTPQELKDVDDVIEVLTAVDRELNSELSSLRDRITEVEASRKSLETLLRDVEGRISRLGEEVKEFEKRVAELESQIKSYGIIYEFCSKYLGKNGLIARELTRIARDELERRTNRILSRLGLRPIEINDDFQIRVKVLGSELPISNASGGERVGISIALRLALAELIMGKAPTTLILDEPTVYLDDERRRQIFEIVKELSKSLRQVIVVTHDESIINIADKVIRVENIGEVSRVTTQ